MADMDWDKIQDTLDSIAEVVDRYTRKGQWTSIQKVILGDGKTPPTVVVPIAQRDGARSIWVHSPKSETKDAFQVENGLSGITFNAEMAGLVVEIGKPPNSEIMTIMRLTSESLMQTHGIQPSQIVEAQSYIVTPDKFQEIKAYTEGGAILKITTGKLRINNYFVAIQPDASVDLNSYIPTDPDTMKWVLVDIDQYGAFSVIEGDQLSITTDLTPQEQIPRTFNTGKHQICYVRLIYGAIFSASDILPASNIPSTFSFVSTTDDNDLSTSYNGYVFSSFNSSSQVIEYPGIGVISIIALGTTTLDPSFMRVDEAVIPSKEGYYEVSATLTVSDGTDNWWGIYLMEETGSAYHVIRYFNNYYKSGVSSGNTLHFNEVVYANGTGDGFRIGLLQATADFDMTVEHVRFTVKFLHPPVS
jgi:hypothetical protein